MDDWTKEPLLPEVKVETNVEQQRFKYQCPSCGSLKFEVLFIKSLGVRTLILTCQKGHDTVLENVPEVKNG